MVNLIFINEDGHKMARPVHRLEDLISACNTPENVENWNQYRQTGDDRFKHALVQVSYNCQVPEGGQLKGIKTVSPFFFYDIDCGNREECRRIIGQLLRMKDQLGLVEVSESASYGVHAVGIRQPGTTILENQVRISILTRTEMDTNNKENNRVVFHGPIDAETTPLLDEALFRRSLTDEEAAEEYKLLKEREKKGLERVPAAAKKANKHYRPWEDDTTTNSSLTTTKTTETTKTTFNGDKLSPDKTESLSYPTEYHGIPFTEILKKYWEVNNRGYEPTKGDRDTLTYQLACDLRHICGKNADWLDQVIPCYDGFSPEEKRQKIESALNSDLEAFPSRLRNVLNALERKGQTEDVRGEASDVEADSENVQSSMPSLQSKKMPLGVRDSINAVGSALAMPVVTAICPCIGALATGVELDVHGQKKGLNLIAYIAGEFASRKGSIDPVIEAWMGEVRALDMMYQQQEEDFRAKKRAAKNKKDQPEEPKLPVRFITLNTTVANLAERLGNTEGKHAFSFTPEADTVAQKWRSAMSDFSVMLRQSYDGSRYEREARSAEAVNVHIEKLLWCVTMCGTPDCLYRVVNNYTDGFQSRIAVARTPDNTFDPLEDKPPVLTERQTEHIQQVAHLLPLMQGEVTLPKLEAKGREWLERIRLETMKNDDKVKARQRFRVCVTAQRMTCCLMLCKVCETLIQKYGLNGAETRLKQQPTLWKEMLLKTQTPSMLEAYDVIADSLMDNALYFFRDRIENAFGSRDYAGYQSGERLKRGKNDSIYERLDVQFTFEQAMQHSVAVKGASVSRNSVRQMLKNWKNQGLIVQTEEGKYRKIE